MVNIANVTIFRAIDTTVKYVADQSTVHASVEYVHAFSHGEDLRAAAK